MKKMESIMAFIGLAGAASTVGLAAFALFNVVYNGAYNPNLPVNLVKEAAVKTTIDKAASTAEQKIEKVVGQKNTTPVPATKPKVIQVANSSETADSDTTEDEPTILYTDPPAKTAKEQEKTDQAVEALKNSIKNIDYERAKYHPLHFKPQIASASNEECLVCHSEIMTRKPRESSPAGVKASDVLAWYQTLDTYKGKQESFHFRHLESEFSQQVMNLSCTFCHKGNDPREETPDMQPGQSIFSAPAKPNFTLRKMVNPSTTCLRCHGDFPYKVMDGVEGPWHKTRIDFEDEETPNGCLTCHEESFRTNRHHVNYLKAAGIEELAKNGSDVCYGCHGGRKWYRNSFPYARSPWPDMDEETPDWAKDRPTKPDLEHQRKAAK